MTDMFDRASDLEQVHRDAAIAAVQNKVQTDVASAEFCEECGDEIPLARREAVHGCQFCVVCQSRIERNSAHRRHYG